jgi:hypothetical protein
MAYKILNLPTEEDAAKQMAQSVGRLCAEFGVSINAQVLIPMWANGDIKVIVEYAPDAVGICLMRHGDNTTTLQKSASILDIKSKVSVPNFYEFCKTVAQALNCRTITATLREKLETVPVAGYYHEESI